MKLPKKKKSERQLLEKELDKLWSKCVLTRDKYKCQYCRQEGNNPHHIFSRSNKNTRWDLENGITLCVSHHTFNSNFSAHLAPRNWWIWLEEKRGKKWVDQLEQRANISAKGLDLQAIKIYLTQILNKLI